MPDEPVWGQYIRTMHINGLPNDQAMLDAIHALGNPSRRLKRRVALHFLAGTRHLWDYFRAHSVHLQLGAAFAWATQSWNSKQILNRWHFHHSRYFPSPCVVRRCPQCLIEDHAQHGYSWFRRIHQLPGVEWCPTHGTALDVAPSAGSVVASKLAFKKVDHLCDLDAAPAFIRRYIMALEWLCACQNVSARAHLESWIEEEGAGPNSIGWEPGFWSEEAVTRNAPDEWFAAQFVQPCGNMKRWGFGGLSPGGYNPALALLTAALTTSVADVAALIASAEAVPRPRLQ